MQRPSDRADGPHHKATHAPSNLRSRKFVSIRGKFYLRFAPLALQLLCQRDVCFQHAGDWTTGFRLVGEFLKLRRVDPGHPAG
jgi:hypothetical protein